VATNAVVAHPLWARLQRNYERKKSPVTYSTPNPAKSVTIKLDPSPTCSCMDVPMTPRVVAKSSVKIPCPRVPMGIVWKRRVMTV
jgi:hypothetical protein